MKIYKFSAVLAVLLILFLVMQFSCLFLFNTHHRFDTLVLAANTLMFFIGGTMLYVSILFALHHLKERKWYLAVFSVPGLLILLMVILPRNTLPNELTGGILGIAILTAFIVCFLIEDRKVSLWFKFLGVSFLIALLIIGIGMQRSAYFGNPNIFVLCSIVAILPLGILWKLNSVLASMQPRATDSYLLDKGQPTNCPQCGTRTNFYGKEPERQVHHCPSCSYNFIGTFDEGEAEGVV